MGEFCQLPPVSRYDSYELQRGGAHFAEAYVISGSPNQRYDGRYERIPAECKTDREGSTPEGSTSLYPVYQRGGDGAI
jgi:hypothetical protein